MSAGYISSYRALVASSGKSALLSHRLLKQLHFSPLCREVIHLTTAQDAAVDGSPFVSPKIAHFSHFSHADKANMAETLRAKAPQLVFLLDEDSFTDLPGIPSCTNAWKPLHISSVYFTPSATLSHGVPRVSLFKPAFVYDPADFDRPFFDRTRTKTALYAVYAQFLPEKFREVSVDDLALALRLNAELCAPAASAGAAPSAGAGAPAGVEGVFGNALEILEFADIMQVIGKSE